MDRHQHESLHNFTIYNNSLNQRNDVGDKLSLPSQTSCTCQGSSPDSNFASASKIHSKRLGQFQCSNSNTELGRTNHKNLTVWSCLPSHACNCEGKGEDQERNHSNAQHHLTRMDSSHGILRCFRMTGWPASTRGHTVLCTHIAKLICWQCPRQWWHTWAKLEVQTEAYKKTSKSRPMIQADTSHFDLHDR